MKGWKGKMSGRGRLWPPRRVFPSVSGLKHAKVGWVSGISMEARLVGDGQALMEDAGPRKETVHYSTDFVWWIQALKWATDDLARMPPTFR